MTERPEGQPLDPPHIEGNASKMHANKLMYASADLPRCISCFERVGFLRAPDVGWAINHVHEPPSPQHHDNIKAVEYHAVEIEEALKTRWELEKSYWLPVIDHGPDDEQQHQA
jgi:hypothetical protein